MNYLLNRGFALADHHPSYHQPYFLTQNSVSYFTQGST
jgi:hypothetical protein